MHRPATTLLLAVFLVFSWMSSASAQNFSISGGPSFYDGVSATLFDVTISNDSETDQISTFTISNIYSVTQPSTYEFESFWDYNFLQNPTNACLWTLSVTDTWFITYISPSSSQVTEFYTYSPQPSMVLTGPLPASVGFVAGGIAQSNSSAFIGPVGWQSGPLLASMQLDPTNGTIQFVWSGADGNVFIDSRNSLTEGAWQPFAGPFSGGACAVPMSTNSDAMFFRLRLGQ